MLINIILALHFGQAGRSNGADGTAGDRRWDWVMVLPFTKRREHNTLGRRYCPGRGPAMEQVYAARNSAASQFRALGADRTARGIHSGWRRTAGGLDDKRERWALIGPALFRDSDNSSAYSVPGSAGS